MFSNGWFGPVRVVIVGTLAYSALVLLLRVSGKRTLSKMNAFDLIVTVALGSTLATILLSKDTPLIEGVTAFALLVGLQFALTWLSVRYRRVENLVKAEPTLLYFQGRFLSEVLRRERVTEADVRAAIRAQGRPDTESVGAVVLETDGTLTVLQLQEKAHYSSLGSINRPDP